MTGTRNTPVFFPSLLLLFAVVGGFSACRERGHGPTHTYLEQVYAYVDHPAYAIKTEVAQHYFDSVYRSGGQLGVVDSYFYFYVHAIQYRRVKKDLNQALSCVDSLLLYFSRHRNHKDLMKRYAEALSFKGDLLFATNDPQAALNFYLESLGNQQTETDPCNAGETQHRIAMVFYKQRDYPLAASHFQQSYRLLDDCTDSFKYIFRQQEILNSLGLCHLNVRQYDSADRFFNLALQKISYLEQEYGQDSVYRRDCGIAKAVVYGNMASVAYAAKRLERAESLLRLSIAQNLQYHVEIKDALGSLIKLSKFYYQNGDLAAMKQSLDRTGRLLDSFPNAAVAQDWHWLMAVYYEQSSPRLAYRHLKQYHVLNDSLQQSVRQLSALSLNTQINNLRSEFVASAQAREADSARNYTILAAVIVLLCVALMTSIAVYSRGNVPGT